MDGNETSNFARIVTAAYRAFLRREPDPGGLDTYVTELERGRDLQWLLEHFIRSDEFLFVQAKLAGSRTSPEAAKPRTSVRREVFRADKFLVREVRGFSFDRLVVTFSPYGQGKGANPMGFGETFFASRGIDAIHFIANADEWYQFPELLAAAEIIRILTASYSRVVTYGSSMGAYAAIRFGRLVGASEALALSPQFSIDRSVVSFENRWHEEARRIDFLLERSPPDDFVQKAHIVYDPYNLDAHHTALFRPRVKLSEIKIPDCGHPSVGYLAETGILQQIVLDFVDGRLEPEKVELESRRRRKASAQFYFNLSIRANRPGLKLAAARRAAEKASNNAVYQSELGARLAEGGNFAESRTVHARAVEIAPDNTHVLYRLSEFHEIAGEWEAALEAVDKLIRQNPEVAGFQGRRAYLLQKHEAVRG